MSNSYRSADYDKERPIIALEFARQQRRARHSRATTGRMHCLLLLCCATSQDQAALRKKLRTTKPPTAEQLAAITARGKLLSEYDQAAWHASDAVQKLNPAAREDVGSLLARKTEKGWVVAFGQLDPKKDRFLVAYEATQGKDPEEFEVKSLEPPSEDAGFYRSAAKAIDVVLKEFVENFKGEQRPYNVAVLPAEKSELWVYLVPARPSPESGRWAATCGTACPRMGLRIIEKRQLHNAVIESPSRRSRAPTTSSRAGMHTHVLDDIPEDTDVFHVLTTKTGRTRDHHHREVCLRHRSQRRDQIRRIGEGRAPEKVASC